MPDGRKIVFYDSPGQPTSRPERAKVKDKIINRKISGVINVVCYGYNEVAENKLKVFDNEKGIVRPQYLSKNREIELQQLDEWIGDIDSRLKVKWILTLVNKMDVWYTQQEEVMEYYNTGEYHDKFTGIERVCKIQCLAHCSVIEPFGDRPMMLHIGETEKNKCHLQLIETLKNFVSHA